MTLGRLKVQCFSEQRRYIPIDKCKVKITPIGQDGIAIGDTIVLYTNNTGSTDIIELDAPPIEILINQIKFLIVLQMLLLRKKVFCL